MNTDGKHIILGAGGAIGNVLTEELISKGKGVKLVSRKGYSLPGTETGKADLVDYRQMEEVIEQNSTVYLLVGLPYDIRIWLEKWPRIMQNTIEACKRQQAKLIFFDNVYTYGKVDGPMTEETPMNPSSRKGEVRVRLAEQLLSEAKSGNIKALIARAADFYGPFAEKTSLPFVFIFKRLADDKKAQVLVSAKTKHSYTYTGDCGRALYMLASSEDGFGQVWHLPTAGPPLTGEEFIETTASKLGAKPSYTILRKWMVRLGGIFDRQVREVYEMLYQNEYDYIFDSSKFESAFNFEPTSYEAGIEQTVRRYFLQAGHNMA
jgi:nucleoside-diphosphate-sugar epimerase